MALYVDDAVVFALNFLAIIPLAKVLDYFTDQLSIQVGQTVGGLLNAYVFTIAFPSFTHHHHIETGPLVMLLNW